MRIVLSEDEKATVMRLLTELGERYASAEDPELVFKAQVFAHEIPRRVREEMNVFRLREPAAAMCRIAGYPIRDATIGPTPDHWKERQKRCLPVKEEIYLLLLGSLLGDPIAWATQQDGALVHDIAPIKANEHEQLGSGSREELTWHTEDAFHPFCGDYIGLMCMRNPDSIPTTFASIEVSGLEKHIVATLFKPWFTIRPDKSHLTTNRIDPISGETIENAYARIDEMNAQPGKISVFYGSVESPYCRIDPYFMDPPEEAEAQYALTKMIEYVDSRLEEVVLEPGEICFIDNFKAVHGRRSFKARYDGTDRWMKRINITRNLRTSRVARLSPESRVLC